MSYYDSGEKAGIKSYYESVFFTSKYAPALFPDMKNELENYPLKNALEKAENIINELGIKNLGEPVIYSATADAMNKYFEENECGFEADVLDDDEGFYSIYYPSVFDDVSVINQTVTMKSLPTVMGNNASFVHFILSKDKIITFQCCYPFDGDEIESVGETEINADAKAAALSLMDFYADKNDDEQYEFDSCGLYYITSEFNYEKKYIVYKPVWTFKGFYEAEDGMLWNSAELIDPETGTVYAANLE